MRRPAAGQRSRAHASGCLARGSPNGQRRRAQASRPVLAARTYTTTVGLDRDQARALIADADAQAMRTAAVVRLLLHNALRVDEACPAAIGDLVKDSGV